MNFKLWIKVFLCTSFFILFLFGCIVVVIDPFFHFSRPNKNFYYDLDFDYERYLNDGILRHFSYNAIITGTSMSEHFRSSEAEYIFGGQVIKVPFAGGGFKEINDNLVNAFKYNDEVKYVIRSLDYTYLFNEPKNNNMESLPIYLYNDSYLDDIFYILNMDSLFLSIKCLKNTIENGNGITSFDEYGNRMNSFKFGASNVLRERKYYAVPELKKFLDESRKIYVKNNVCTNVVSLAKNHPETTFYYFFPPYSIAYYGELYEKGELELVLESEKIAIEIIINQPNIKLFSFNLNKNLVTDLDNYADHIHYGEWVNSKILYWMKNDIGRITKENYKEYLHNEREFFMNYDYNSLFLQKDNKK